MAFARNDLDHTLTLQMEALRLRVSVLSSGGLGGSFDKIAAIAAAREDHESAARLFGASEGIRTEHGVTLQSNDREANRPHIGRAERALGRERFIDLWGEGASMIVDDAIEYALQFGSPTGQQSPSQLSQVSGGRRLAHRSVDTTD